MGFLTRTLLAQARFRSDGPMFSKLLMMKQKPKRCLAVNTKRSCHLTAFFLPCLSRRHCDKLHSTQPTARNAPRVRTPPPQPQIPLSAASRDNIILATGPSHPIVACMCSSTTTAISIAPRERVAESVLGATISALAVIREELLRSKITASLG